MKNVRSVGKILAIISGALEILVSFIFYWIIYAAVQSSGNMLPPMVVLFCGLLGGILAIISAIFIRTTKITGAILVLVAAALATFTTIYLMSMKDNNIQNTIIVALPFFVVPNALCIAGGLMSLVAGIQKDSAEK